MVLTLVLLQILGSESSKILLVIWTWTAGTIEFKKTTTDAEFREIDASQITRNIEAVQKKINTARVQAGSQYAALESAVIYTTDLTAQYELGYNTVHDVNFSMETAHTWQRTKSYSRPQLPCWRKPIRDSKVFYS